jgi:alkylhydroperoxidase family enzyme
MTQAGSDASQQRLRIQPVTTLPDELRSQTTPPADVQKRYGERATKGPNLFSILAHNPGMTQRFFPLSTYLAMSGMLPPRDREIAVMRIAWLNQLPFVWGEHVRLAKQLGMSSDEIEQVVEGSSAETWSEHDRAILRAVEQLREHSTISDDVWDVLARTWSEGQLVELPILIGTYQSLGYVQNALRYPLWEGNPGLAAR